VSGKEFQEERLDKIRRLTGYPSMGAHSTPYHKIDFLERVESLQRHVLMVMVK